MGAGGRGPGGGSGAVGVVWLAVSVRNQLGLCACPA